MQSFTSAKHSTWIWLILTPSVDAAFIIQSNSFDVLPLYPLTYPNVTNRTTVIRLFHLCTLTSCSCVSLTCLHVVCISVCCYNTPMTWWQCQHLLEDTNLGVCVYWWTPDRSFWFSSLYDISRYTQNYIELRLLPSLIMITTTNSKDTNINQILKTQI